MPKGMDYNEYFRNAMENPEARELYRRVLDEELFSLLRYLGEKRGGPLDEVPGGLDASLEEIARYVQKLGLSLRLEFVDKEGKVLAQYVLSQGEPVEPFLNPEKGDVSL